CEQLKKQGFTPEVHSYHEIINGKFHPQHSLVFYSFSQRPNVRQFITDMVRYLDDGTNLLIPSYDLLRCHENKGFQELFKKQHGISTLPAYYFSHPDQLADYDLTFPMVLKAPGGSNGTQVFLIRDKAHFREVWRKQFHYVSLGQRLDLWRRRYFRREKHYHEYPNYSNTTDYEQYRHYIVEEQNFVFQQFVPNLKYDYRVLAVHDKYFITRRMNRDNDFRASGAKKFVMDFEANPEMLDYAREVYQKSDSPYLSMDICESDSGFDLIEFQAIHFGISVIIRNKGYYQHVNGNWELVPEIASLEDVLAYGFAGYIRDRTNWFQEH
ncbi:hypothetical protein KAH55_08950, partial [bacterium]|nr:hypothetical protein [bacterium]